MPQQLEAAGLVDLFLSRPLVTVPLGAKLLKVTPKAVDLMLTQLGGALPRESPAAAAIARGDRVRYCPRGLDYCVPGGWIKGTSVGMAGGSSPGRSGGSSGGKSGPGSGAGWSVGGSGGISGSGLSDIGFSSVNRCQDKALIVGVFRL